MNNLCQFSPDRAHRYTLTHSIVRPKNPLHRIMWIGLNPSTADEQKLDPTLRWIRAFSRTFGFAEFVMTNLFAFRATKPNDMFAAADPIGPLNDAYLLGVAAECEMIVAAWGVHGVFQNRAEHVLRLLSHRSIQCLARSKDGHPRHPLYIKGSAGLQMFQQAKPDAAPARTMLDHYLVARAEAAATGENAHEVRHAIAVYQGYLSLPDHERCGYIQRIEGVETRLRVLVATGKLPASEEQKGAAA